MRTYSVVFTDRELTNLRAIVLALRQLLGDIPDYDELDRLEEKLAVNHRDKQDKPQ